MNNKSNAEAFAEKEFKILKQLYTDPKENLVLPYEQQIMEILKIFGNEGHSGGAAPFGAAAISQVIKKLCLFEPITPVMGTVDEWVNCEHMDGKDLYQNNRCSALFKEGKDGTPYYLDAINWKTETSGTWSTYQVDGVCGRQYVKSFPFVPKTFYIDVIETEVKPDDWVFSLKNKEDVKEVFEYYDEFTPNHKS